MEDFVSMHHPPPKGKTDTEEEPGKQRTASEVMKTQSEELQEAGSGKD